MTTLLSSEEKLELKEAVASVRHELQVAEYELGRRTLAKTLKVQYKVEGIDGKELMHGYRITTPRRGKLKRNGAGECILDKLGKKTYEKGYRKNHTVMNLDLWKLLFQKRVCRLESKGAEGRLLFIDFDFIPECFCTSSWDTFFELMQARVGYDGFVFRSASNKVKVMHVFNGLLEGGAVNFNYFSIAKDMYPDLIEAKEIVGFTDDKPIFKYCIDRLGFEHSYLDIDTLELLDQNFAHIKTMNNNSLSVYTIVEPNSRPDKVNPYDHWNLYDMELPFELPSFNKVKQFIFRILAGSLYLSVGNGMGLGLSSTLLADKLSCSQEYVSRMLREMIRDGIIKKTSNHFMGFVAARYKFEGKYKDWGIMKKNKIKAENKSVNSEENLFQRRESAASEMVSGKINEISWKVAKENLFRDRQELQEWALELPAVQEQPKRLAVVLKAFDKQQKWLEEHKQREKQDHKQREEVAA